MAEADLSSLRFCTNGETPPARPPGGILHQEKASVLSRVWHIEEFTGRAVCPIAEGHAIARQAALVSPTFLMDARIVDPATNRPLGPSRSAS
ncbi:MAG: hypothetical protein U0401_10160 [Anaerolineae bacterium]